MRNYAAVVLAMLGTQVLGCSGSQPSPPSDSEGDNCRGCTLLTSELANPDVLAVDQDTVFAIDQDLGAIVSVPMSGGNPSTLAADLGRPYRLFVDDALVYYVAGANDGSSNWNVYSLPKTGGMPTHIFDVSLPSSLVGAAGGQVYESASDATTGVTKLIAHSGTDPSAAPTTVRLWDGTSASSTSPLCVYLASGGRLVWCDSADGLWLAPMLDGTPQHLATGAPSAEAQELPDGRFAVLDAALGAGGSWTVRVVGADGSQSFQASIAPQGLLPFVALGTGIVFRPSAYLPFATGSLEPFEAPPNILIQEHSFAARGNDLFFGGRALVDGRIYRISFPLP